MSEEQCYVTGRQRSIRVCHCGPSDGPSHQPARAQALSCEGPRHRRGGFHRLARRGGTSAARVGPSWGSTTCRAVSRPTCPRASSSGGSRSPRRSTTLFASFRPDCVYHLAAYAAEGLSHHVPVFNCRNNFEGTANVLSAAYRTGARHFVFTSSIAVYGHPAEPRPFTEEDPCHPCDPYGIAKLACELHLRAFREYYGGPDYTILRPHNVYGPRQNIADPYRNVVGIFMRAALLGQPFPVFGDGLQTRSFSHVSRVAAAVATAPFVPGSSEPGGQRRRRHADHDRPASGDRRRDDGHTARAEAHAPREPKCFTLTRITPSWRARSQRPCRPRWTSSKGSPAWPPTSGPYPCPPRHLVRRPSRSRTACRPPGGRFSHEPSSVLYRLT